MNDRNVVNELRSEKAKLELRLRKINLALEALLGGSVPEGRVRARKQEKTCLNPKCNKKFFASRSDARYCSRDCIHAMDKRRINKGVTLIAGAQK